MKRKAACPEYEDDSADEPARAGPAKSSGAVQGTPENGDNSVALLHQGIAFRY